MQIALSTTELDNAFYALSHTKRRGIIHTLAFRPSTVSQLAQEYDLSLPAIHKHVRVLEQAHLVVRKKHGRTNFMALDSQSLQAVQAWLGQYHTEWGSDKQTLENYIAGLG